MLTELEVKNAKPRETSYMVRDDHGLYLRIDPSGCKYWILRYWENKKEHKTSLGPYPELSFKDARLGAAPAFSRAILFRSAFSRENLRCSLPDFCETLFIEVEEINVHGRSVFVHTDNGKFIDFVPRPECPHCVDVKLIHVLRLVLQTSFSFPAHE